MKSRIDRLRAYLPGQDQSPVGSSRKEKEIFSVAKRVLPSQPECTVENAIFLDGCFEADIVITCTLLDESKIVYNIEVDGPSHSKPTSQRMGRLLRDQHLFEECGVRTARITLHKPDGEWLQSAEYEAVVLRAELQRWQLLLS